MKTLQLLINKREILFALVVPVILFIFYSFFRLYKLEERLVFSLDQVQNSWVMKNLIVDGKYPLTGMVVRQDSGLYLGPAYYYLLAPFYRFYNLSPIAGGVFAFAVSLVTFWITYLVVSKLFSSSEAIVSIFIITFSSAVIVADRIAWPVILIPVGSALILYYLIRSIEESRYLFILAFVCGFLFHVHFTAVFFPIIILLTLPLILKNRRAVRNLLLSLPLFFVWFIPNFIANKNSNFSQWEGVSRYIAFYFNGFHLRRIAQLYNDTFILFDDLLIFKPLLHLGPIFTLLSGLLLVNKFGRRKGLVYFYIFLVWFLVPLVLVSSYSGEISNYYFTSTRIVALIIVSLVVHFLARRWPVVAVVLIFAAFVYIKNNLIVFMRINNSDYPLHKFEADRAVKEDRTIDFKDHDPESYLYYVRSHRFK